MADLNWQGAGSGAAAGAGVGSVIPGVGTAAGAIVGGLAGLFSKKKKRPKALVAPDISAELAKLDALYGTQREMLTADIARQTGLMQQQTAQGLANRGILSSPVSEASLGRIRQQGQTALSGGLAELYSQQASARSAALNSLLQYNMNVQQANQARQQAAYDRQQQFQNQMLGVGLNLGVQALGNMKGKVSDSEWAKRYQERPFEFGSQRLMANPNIGFTPTLNPYQSSVPQFQQNELFNYQPRRIPINYGNLY